MFGALPFVISGDIPNYIDACFEMMSGFTTTGSSVISDITIVSHSTLFWRSFSHWIGGMGILVFVLIFIPESKDGSAMYLLRAESPGPQVGKLVSKMKVTTRILYLIYLGMTVLEVCVLMLDKPIPGYENEKFFFSLYYLILIGKVKDVLRSEEFKAYFAIISVSVALVFLSLVGRFDAFPQTYTMEEAFRHALFQIASLMTTAGYTTTDYHVWPMLATMSLVLVMFIGAMAGSTAGGIKVSRIVIGLKGSYINTRKLFCSTYLYLKCWTRI